MEPVTRWPAFVVLIHDVKVQLLSSTLQEVHITPRSSFTTFSPSQLASLTAGALFRLRILCDTLDIVKAVSLVRYTLLDLILFCLAG